MEITEKAAVAKKQVPVRKAPPVPGQVKRNLLHPTDQQSNHSYEEIAASEVNSEVASEVKGFLFATISNSGENFEFFVFAPKISKTWNTREILNLQYSRQKSQKLLLNIFNSRGNFTKKRRFDFRAKK